MSQYTGLIRGLYFAGEVTADEYTKLTELPEEQQLEVFLKKYNPNHGDVNLGLKFETFFELMDALKEGLRTKSVSPNFDSAYAKMLALAARIKNFQVTQQFAMFLALIDQMVPKSFDAPRLDEVPRFLSRVRSVQLSPTDFETVYNVLEWWTDEQSEQHPLWNAATDLMSEICEELHNASQQPLYTPEITTDVIMVSFVASAFMDYLNNACDTARKQHIYLVRSRLIENARLV